MTKSVRSVPEDLDTAAARHMMRSGRIRHLVVMTGSRIAGVVSQRDLGGTTSVVPAGTVAGVMTANVVVVAPETTIRAAANLLRGRNIGCLPVVDGKQLVGIISTADLLEVIGRGVQKPIARSTRWTLKGRGPRRPRPPEKERHRRA